MTPTQHVFHVDPSSLSDCDQCLTVDGAVGEACLSIHLVFIQSGDDRIDRFYFPEEEQEGIFVVHGVIESRHRSALLSEVYEQQTLTLWVRDAAEEVRRDPLYTQEPEDPSLGINPPA